MSAILAIETSTLTASVALVRDGQTVHENESGVNTHSETLLTLVDECLAKGALTLADLNTIAVGAGPGSFTGLRIGMATVKGLCFAAGVSITPVSSLAALAYDALAFAQEGDVVAAVLDARRKEIFVGLFEKRGDGLHALGDEQVLPPAELASLVERELSEEQRGRILLCGDGAAKYADIVGGLGSFAEKARQTPGAAAVALLARTLPPSDALASAKPTYVRLPEAEIKFPDGNTGGTFSAEAARKKP